MQLIKVAAAVLNQTPLDWDGNLSRIQQALNLAREQHASIVCLPELCITSYGCEDAFHSAAVQRTALEILQEIVPQTAGLITSVGLPLRFRNSLFNTACVLADGKILGFTAKQHLAGDGIHYEPRWFKPWQSGKRTQVEIAGTPFPIGDLFYDCGGIRIGFEICEDAWVASRPGENLSQRGVDLILNPSASHFAFGKSEIRRRFVLEGSRAFSVGYLYANLLGNDAGRAIYDGGAYIASDGQLLSFTERLSFQDVQLCTAVLDVEQNRRRRTESATFRSNLDPEGDACVRVPFEFPTQKVEKTPSKLPAWEQSEWVKEEEFTRAECLALFDYLRKSRSNGVVISMSGGADSAAVATLSSQMLHLATAEIGLPAVLQKLNYLPSVQDSQTVHELVGRLVTTAYQSTRNSSETTRNAAQTVAAAIGTTHYEFDVDTLFSTYVSTVEQAIGRQLAWETDDLALQNIQARVRAPSIWMLANLRGALLLSTSNRSEAAVGYATMDGDTSGGLSPIAGIDKAFLRRWLKWMETTGPQPTGPIPQLVAVTKLPPTAELRPAEQTQTDEADLMPYDLLDAVERAAIRDRKAPVEVLLTIEADFVQYSRNQLIDWITRFFQLWCRNQWKRERYAPSFHLDDENLDPKTWCRFPILSGGFQRELAELAKYRSRN